MSAAPSTPSRILLTGVTGYIGGSVFTHLRTSPLGQSASTFLTVLVRDTPTNAPIVHSLRQLPRVSVELGDQQDPALMLRLVHACDVLVHTADSADDLKAAKAITAALTSATDGRRRLYVHTSGTGILTFGNADARGAYATPDSEVWSDLQLDRYLSIPPEAAHRDVDQVVVDAAKAHPQLFDLVIIDPPTIYGVGSGPGNRLSQQIPTVIRTALKAGHGGTVGAGLNLWNSVHIEDLADLYARIVQAYTGPNPSPSIAHGGGLYFTTAGEFAWGDVQRAVAEELTRRGLLKEPFKEWTTQEAESVAGKMVWMAIGSNSRCRSERAEKDGLGWKPKHVNEVMTTIPSDVDAVVKSSERGKRQMRGGGGMNRGAEQPLC